MKILVTGGAGFLGSHLCRKLLQEGHSVTCLDNLQTGNTKNITDLFLYGPKFLWVEQDVKNPEMCFYYNLFDQIYHLACPASPPKYQEDPVDTLLTNVLGTKNILECARISEYNTRVLLTSTSEIYGDPLEHPQKESYRGNVNSIGPRSCYDEGKRAAETLMYDYQRQFDVDVRVARIFNTYGPNMDLEDGRVVTNFICQTLNDEPLTIYGSGRQTRSLCYVEDQIDGLVRLMNSDYSEPVNIGNDQEVTILELAEEIQKLVDPCKELSYTSLALPVDDPTRRCPDLTTAKSVLGWEPTTTRQQGLSKTIEWIRKELENVTN